MSKVFKFFVVLLAILVFSVVLTPILHSVLHPYFKFEKIFNRLIMIFGVLAALLFILSQRGKTGKFFDHALWKTYGFDFAQPWLKLFSVGVLGGGFTVLLIVLFEIKFGPSSDREAFLLHKIVEWFFTGVGAGLSVGVIEEFFFRGFIYTQLKKKTNIWLAVILASAFYSLCHFFDNGQIFIPQNPSMGDAIRLLFGYLEPFTQHALDILPEFTGLFLFGVLLNLAYIRTGSLFLSIGVHAGAVFFIKFQHAFVEKAPEAYHVFYGNRPYYDGVFEWGMLVILGILIWKFAPQLIFKTRKT